MYVDYNIFIDAQKWVIVSMFWIDKYFKAK